MTNSQAKTFRKFIIQVTMMNRNKLGLFTMAVFLVLLISVRPVTAGDTETMSTDDIESDMKGYGLTVFEGTEIEKFSVTVLDVLKNYFPSQDVILIRVDHEETDHANIIGGMSGSPIYVYGDQENKKNPKLIGALAYGFVSFPKDPVAGVTSIESMKEVKDRPRETGRLRRKNRPRKKNPEDQKSKLRRLTTPLSVSGVTNRTFRKYYDKFSSYGMKPVRAGSAAGVQEAEGSIEPGAAVGIQLISGDLNTAAIGTVTYREDDQVLVFGHPFLSAGEVEFPMTTAYVQEVMASQASSYKMSTPLKSVGTITTDLQAAVAGTYGETPEMVPVDVTVKNAVTDFSRSFDYNVVSDKFFTPLLLDMVAFDSISATESTQFSSLTTEYEIRLKTENYGTISLENAVSGMPFSLVSSPAQALMDNPFDTELNIKNVKVDVSIEHENRQAVIQRSWVRKTKVSPGETVTVHMKIRPYGEDPVIKKYDLDLPENLPEGTYRIKITPGDLAPQPKYAPEDMKEYVEVLQKQGRSDRLALSLKVPRIGITSGSRELSGVPPSVLGAFVGNRETGILIQEHHLVKREPFSWILAGTDSLKLNVEK